MSDGSALSRWVGWAHMEAAIVAGRGCGRGSRAHEAASMLFDLLFELLIVFMSTDRNQSRQRTHKSRYLPRTRASDEHSFYLFQAYGNLNVSNLPSGFRPRRMASSDD